MYKTNQTKRKTIEEFKSVLMSNEMLLCFDVLKKANATVLVLEKESQKIEHCVYGDNQICKMIEFLEELKVDSPTHIQDDIDLIIEEIELED